MSLKSRFLEIFGPAWNQAGTIARDVEHELGAVLQFIDQEFAMIPQNIADALARIKAALAGSSDQAAQLQQQVTALQAQVSDLTAAGQAKDAQIADLQGQLNDATAQIADIEAAVLAAAPPQ